MCSSDKTKSETGSQTRKSLPIFLSIGSSSLRRQTKYTILGSQARWLMLLKACSENWSWRITMSSRPAWTTFGEFQGHISAWDPGITKKILRLTSLTTPVQEPLHMAVTRLPVYPKGTAYLHVCKYSSTELYRQPKNSLDQEKDVLLIKIKCNSPRKRKKATRTICWRCPVDSGTECAVSVLVSSAPEPPALSGNVAVTKLDFNSMLF